MVKNLTEGKPLNLLFFFALPMVAGNLFQQLYNMVDTAVVGKFVGEDAVAAVGSSFPIVFLSVAVASGLSMGCNVVVSQLFGARRIHEMKTTISTAIISLSVLGLIIMALGTVFAGPLLQLLGTDPDIMDDSRLYLRIYFGGAVFLFLYNTLNGMPMVAGNLFQQLYNMVDTAVVGKFVGEDAVAAVGSSFPIVFLSVAVASGLSMGCNVVVSQLFGARRIHEMKTTISTAIISLSVLGLIIMALGTVFAGPLLQLLGTDPDIMDDSRLYLRIYFGGAVFLFLYNTLNGIYNAQGDSKTPLIFLMISSLTNIVLDLLFVIQFNMGVAGVAWATLIAQGMCAIASLVVMFQRMKKLPCEPERANMKIPLFHMTAVKRIAQIGLPSMLQQSLVSLSMMMMQGLVNSFGKVLVAGYTAATKIDTLAMLPNMNFSNAMSSYTAQNIGAGKYDRVKEGLKACLFMVVVFSLVITVIIFLFGSQLLSLFLDPGDTSGAMGYGLAYMRTVSVFYILMGVLFVPNGMLRGAGDMGAFTLSSMANLFSRVAIAYALVYLTPFGANAIWWSIPAGWAVGAAVSLLRVKSGKWMRTAVADR